MIARSWTGIIRTEDRDAYAAYLDETGLKGYRETPGNVDAHLLYRDLGDGRTEVTTFSLWQSDAHIRAFAGDDIRTAVFYPEDDRFLLERDLEVKHYDAITASAPRVDDIVIDCPDADELAAFYSALLGRPARRLRDNWVTLDGPAPRLSFQQVDGYRAPDWPGQEVPQQVHLDLVVDDFEAADVRALALGALAAGDIQPPVDEPWRVYLDPVGHPFCLVTVAPGARG